MSWEVFRGVSDAAAASREFLLPVEPARWLRLCLLSLFVGTGWLALVVARFAPFPRVLTFDATLLPAVDAVALLTVAVGATALSAFGLADPFARFVFLDALRYDRLHLSERLGTRLGRAVRLLLFTLGGGALVTAAAGTVVHALRSGWTEALGTTANGWRALSETVLQLNTPLELAVTLVAAAVLACVVGGVVGFFQAAAAFVPPAMVSADEGAVAAWERVWNAFAGRRGAFLSYLGVRLLLGAAVGLLGLVAAAALASLLGIVGFVVLVALFGSVAAAVSTLGAAPLAAVAVVLALGLVVLPVRGVTLSLLLTYDLAVLSAVAPELALPDADVTGNRAHERPADLAGDVPIVEEPLTPVDGESGDSTEGSEQPGVTDGGESGETGAFEFGVVDGEPEPRNADRGATDSGE